MTDPLEKRAQIIAVPPFGIPHYSPAYLRDSLDRLRRLRAVFQNMMNAQVPAAAWHCNWPIDLRNLPLLSISDFFNVRDNLITVSEVLYAGRLNEDAYQKLRSIRRRTERLWAEAIRIVELDYQPHLAMVGDSELTRNAVHLIDLLSYWRNFVAYRVKGEIRLNICRAVDMSIPGHILHVDLSIPLQRMTEPYSRAIQTLYLCPLDNWLSFTIRRVHWLQKRRQSGLAQYPDRNRYVPDLEFFAETGALLSDLEPQYASLFTSLSPLLSYEWSTFLFLVHSSTLWRTTKITALKALLNHYLDVSRPSTGGQKLSVTDIAVDYTSEAGNLAEGEQHCCICLERYQRGKYTADGDAERPFMIFHCNHIFGRRCLEHLILQSEANNERCPLCRQYVWINLSSIPAAHREQWRRIEELEKSVVAIDERVDTYLALGYMETHNEAFEEVMEILTEYHNAIVEWCRARAKFEVPFQEEQPFLGWAENELEDPLP